MFSTLQATSTMKLSSNCRLHSFSDSIKTSARTPRFHNSNNHMEVIPLDNTLEDIMHNQTLISVEQTKEAWACNISSSSNSINPTKWQAVSCHSRTTTILHRISSSNLVVLNSNIFIHRINLETQQVQIHIIHLLSTLNNNSRIPLLHNPQLKNQLSHNNNNPKFKSNQKRKRNLFFSLKTKRRLLPHNKT